MLPTLASSSAHDAAVDVVSGVTTSSLYAALDYQVWGRFSFLASFANTFICHSTLY